MTLLKYIKVIYIYFHLLIHQVMMANLKLLHFLLIFI